MAGLGRIWLGGRLEWMDEPWADVDAAGRGLSVVLCEQNDLGSATSSASTKLIHGGLRYLQSLDLARFRESVAERRWWLSTFPDLVRPLSCLMPLYGNGLRRPSVLRAALAMNDLLSARRNVGVEPGCALPRGRGISDVLLAQPHLAAQPPEPGQEEVQGLAQTEQQGAPGIASI